MPKTHQITEQPSRGIVDVFMCDFSGQLHVLCMFAPPVYGHLQGNLEFSDLSQMARFSDRIFSYEIRESIHVF